MDDGTVSVPTESGSIDKGVNEKANFGGWIASVIVIFFLPTCIYCKNFSYNCSSLNCKKKMHY